MTPLEWATLSRVSREILRIFHGFKSRSQDIFVRQIWLAKTIGCTREQVCRCIAALARLGFISKLRRYSHFWTYRLEKYQITGERNTHVTSLHGSSILTTEPRERGRKKPRKTWTDWLEYERLVRKGMSHEEALVGAAMTA
ncbi:MAG TPA: hypothetical protein VJQ59_16895 [Candidatus Sulfotelmatobacter sp.]|nr:hypothetical protein [Candidatus Sulfotelmatobacter sp.]